MVDINRLKELASGATVLFVEDDVSTMESISAMLSNLFTEVITASDGKSALEIYKDRFEWKGIDIVITDLSLGELNGVSLIREIKRLNEFQSIIVSSAYEQSDIFIEIIDSGVDSYLLKPMNPDKFLLTLEKTLESVRLKKIANIRREAIENKLAQLSLIMENAINTDTLTGLENEQQMLKALHSNKNHITLMMIKIDNLVDIKKITGKEYSDFYMTEITALLLEYFENFNKNIKVYRIDFDNLAITLDMPYEHISIIAEELCAMAAHYFVTKEQITLNSTFTIGAYCGCAEDIYYRAISVFTRAMEIRRGAYLVQKEEFMLENTVTTNIQWLKAFSESIEENRLVPYYQPIMDNKTGVIEKYECLARIKDKDRGVIPPSMFIGLTQKVRQTPLLAKVIIRKAFEYLAKQDEKIQFSINLTPQDMLDNTIFKLLFYWQEKLEIKPERIVIELLETEDLYSHGPIRAHIRNLRETGYKLAIDDFGIGYSNFVYLFEQQVDYIKIDGTLIKNLDFDRSLAKSVDYINKLIHLTGAKSVAEYVHNEKILKIVQDIGIDYSQGFAIGKAKSEIIR